MHQFNEEDLTPLLKSFFDRLGIYPLRYTTQDISRIFHRSVNGFSATAYYVLKPTFDCEDVPIRSTKYPLIYNCRPETIITLAIYIAGSIGGFTVAFLKYYPTDVGLAIARGGAMLIYINLPLTFFPLIFLHKVPFHSHRIAGTVIVFASILHIIGHIVYGKSVSDAAAVTGWILAAILLISIPWAYIQEPHNVFYYTHQLLLFVFVPLALMHIPFSPWKADALLWMIMVPIILLYFYFRGQKYNPKKTWIQGVTLVEDVLIVQVNKSFMCGMGQYLSINIPEISRFEYHPFSITSAPNDPVVTMHIQRRGDWTDKLIKMRDIITYINYDGPFYTTTRMIVKYRIAIIVAIGIGITPFISIINNCPAHTTIYVIFTTRQQHLFTFIKPAPTVIIYPHLTRWQPSHNIVILKAISDAVFDVEGIDFVTGLPSRTTFRRPTFDCITDIRREHDGPIGLFFCGPYAVESSVRKMCKGIDFYTENF